MEYKNILIIKMSSLGDILHTLPFVSVLRKRFENSRISWLVHPQFADFIPYPSVVDEVIFFDKVKFMKMSLFRKIGYFLEIRKLLRSKKFDLVIDMQGLFKSAILALISGCKVRIGYCEMRELSGFVSRAVHGQHADSHVIERYLDVARFLGAEVKSIDFPMSDLSEAQTTVCQKLKRYGVDRQYVVLVHSARWKTKEWPLEYYAELAKMIMEDGFCVVLAGSQADKKKSQIIKSLDSRIIDLTGETNLKELAALIKLSTFYISADTGPLHFAAAFKKPLIAMYGPTLHARTGAYPNEGVTTIVAPVPCVGCLRKKCGDWHCMRSITPDNVYAAFKDRIGEING